MRILYIAFILFSAYSKIQAANSDSLFFLIPQPKKIEIRNGKYDFSNPYSENTNTNQFYLQQLEDVVTKKFRTKPASSVNKIRLIKADSTDFDKIINDEKLSPPFALGAEGYIISIYLLLSFIPPIKILLHPSTIQNRTKEKIKTDTCHRSVNSIEI